MPPKNQTVIKLLENIGLVAFGVTNGIGGTHLWSINPFLTVSLYILSLICIIRGVAELLEWAGFGRPP